MTALAMSGGLAVAEPPSSDEELAERSVGKKRRHRKATSFIYSQPRSLQWDRSTWSAACATRRDRARLHGDLVRREKLEAASLGASARPLRASCSTLDRRRAGGGPPPRADSGATPPRRTTGQARTGGGGPQGRRRPANLFAIDKRARRAAAADAATARRPLGQSSADRRASSSSSSRRRRAVGGARRHRRRRSTLRRLGRRAAAFNPSAMPRGALHLAARRGSTAADGAGLRASVQRSSRLRRRPPSTGPHRRRAAAAAPPAPKSRPHDPDAASSRDDGRDRAARFYRRLPRGPRGRQGRAPAAADGMGALLPAPARRRWQILTALCRGTSMAQILVRRCRAPASPCSA